MVKSVWFLSFSVLLLTTPIFAKLRDVEEAALLKGHNALRSKATPAASAMMKMEWDDELSSSAQVIAETCPRTEKPRADNLGMNIAWMANDVTVEDALLKWASASEQYNYEENRCDSAVGECSDFQQVMFDDARFLGCGKNICEDPRSQKQIVTFVCLYKKALNSYAAPWKQGTSCSACPTGFRCEDKLCVDETVTSLSSNDNANTTNATTTPAPTRRPRSTHAPRVNDNKEDGLPEPINMVQDLSPAPTYPGKQVPPTAMPAMESYDSRADDFIMPKQDFLPKDYKLDAASVGKSETPSYEKMAVPASVRNFRDIPVYERLAMFQRKPISAASAERVTKAPQETFDDTQILGMSMRGNMKGTKAPQTSQSGNKTRNSDINKGKAVKPVALERYSKSTPAVVESNATESMGATYAAGAVSVKTRVINGILCNENGEPIRQPTPTPKPTEAECDENGYRLTMAPTKVPSMKSADFDEGKWGKATYERLAQKVNASPRPTMTERAPIASQPTNLPSSSLPAVALYEQQAQKRWNMGMPSRDNMQQQYQMPAAVPSQPMSSRMEQLRQFEMMRQRVTQPQQPAVPPMPTYSPMAAQQQAALMQQQMMMGSYFAPQIQSQNQLSPQMPKTGSFAEGAASMIQNQQQPQQFPSIPQYANMMQTSPMPPNADQQASLDSKNTTAQVAEPVSY